VTLAGWEIRLLRLPRTLLALLGVYFAASLLHFSHNAETIALYPGMPAWLTSEKVYLAWLAVTGVGACGLALVAGGWPRFGIAVLGVYGLLGLSGLGHYTLALCSEHTLAANATIGFEVLAGLALAGAAIRQGGFPWSGFSPLPLRRS
jgi:hypothetical protein